ncbi:MAG: hypothetical protein RBR97_19150 [Bacteroidales bacterium]|nr:hypothetical protein [Bacteroidales bacterium]
MLTKCFKCGNDVYKWQTEGGRHSDLPLYQVVCKNCGLKVDSIDKDASWNELSMEVQLLLLAEQNECKHIAYDNGLEFLNILDKTGVKKATLTKHLGKLCERCFFEKKTFPVSYDMDGMDGKRTYPIYSITEHGLGHLRRLKRDYKIA